MQFNVSSGDSNWRTHFPTRYTVSMKNYRNTRHSGSPSRRRARRNRYIRDTYNSALFLSFSPPLSSFYLSNLVPIPRLLSFCRCNLSPLITRSRKFVHISVSQPPTPLLSFCTPLFSPPTYLSSVSLPLFSSSCRPSTQFQGTSRTDTVYRREGCDGRFRETRVIFVFVIFQK